MGSFGGMYYEGLRLGKAIALMSLRRTLRRHMGLFSALTRIVQSFLTADQNALLQKISPKKQRKRGQCSFAVLVYLQASPKKNGMRKRSGKPLWMKNIKTLLSSSY